MEFTYEQVKKYLEFHLENIAGWKKDKKLQERFYNEAYGVVDFILRLSDETNDKTLSQKVCDLWNGEMMPKMAKKIWG